MRRISIEHTTRYRYPEAVTFLEHKLHVRPREGHDIRIESSSLQISPAYEIDWQRDVFNNSVAVVRFSEKANELQVVSGVVVQQYAEGANELALADHARQYPFHYDSAEQVDLIPYQLSVFPQDSAIVSRWMEDVWRPGKLIDTTVLLDKINRKLVEDIAYAVRHEPGVQSPAVTLKLGKGSCRDVATFFTEACRLCGLASRFVSGYLGSNAAVTDHATTHAWSEVYLPGAGWRGFDSTSGQQVGGDHIAVAVHRHPEAIPPVSGAFVGPMSLKPKLEVDVKVVTL